MAGLSSGVIAGLPFGVPFERPSRRPTGRAAFGDSLAGVPEELQTLLWEEFWQAVEPVSDFAAQTPPGTRHALPPRSLTHCGERFQTAHLGGQQWTGLCRLWRVQFWLAADALEALILDHYQGFEYALIFNACCTRIGQIYHEAERRGGTWFAMFMLYWEGRMLRYRGSLAVEPLLFEEVGRPRWSA
jgi:hypothetical protein